MSKYVLFLLVLILNYVSGFGQTELIGQVIDALTEEPIPYVNIGLVDENIGTVSDEQGYFQLEIDPLQYSQSNLRFSMIGFESKTYVLQEYLQKELLIIPLTEESTELEEVVVSTKRTQFETKILGNKTTTKFIYAAFTTNKL